MPNGVVRKEGLEPPYLFRYQILSLARLPVPPLSLASQPSRGSGNGKGRIQGRRNHFGAPRTIRCRYANGSR